MTPPVMCDLPMRLTKPPRLTHCLHALPLRKPRSKYHRIHLEANIIESIWRLKISSNPFALAFVLR
jgi:hypothetical protein